MGGTDHVAGDPIDEFLSHALQFEQLEPPGLQGFLAWVRGDQAEKLGLTYDALREANPAIVCAHLSAYGRTGSRRPGGCGRGAP